MAAVPRHFQVATKTTVQSLGQYPTPVWVAEALIERYFPNLDRSDVVLEPSCGPGSFLSAIPRQVRAVGVEIDPGIAQQARLNTGREVLTGDFRDVELNVTPSAIIGNPPFNMKTIDGFLDRAYELLPNEGRVGFLLPAYVFQTASRVVDYSKRWSLSQEMIPKNIYPRLSLPLVFAMFSKDRKRTLVGFALYGEALNVQLLPKPYRAAMSAGGGPIWKNVVDEAMRRLGGEASLKQIYDEVEGHRPTTNKFWREKIRQTLRVYDDRFQPLGDGRYAVTQDDWTAAP
jgi:hypothetical protein